MKKIQILAVLIAFSMIDAQAAMDHSAHRGKGASAEKGGASCVRPHLSKMFPAHLSTVAPGSEFSFVVSSLDDPDQVFVEVKRQPVEVKVEFVNPYYLVKGKIPDSLKGTAARVDVKIESKVSSCRAEDGWLLKISEN
ncbi:MAG: hypothetical protein IPN42_07200 [Methylococcaceae bacterium]|nr:hypothetical protein [Methylococcaceae bacterium]